MASDGVAAQRACGCIGHVWPGVNHMVACCEVPHIEDQDAMERGMAGMALSVAPLSDTTRREFARVLADFIASGAPFDSDAMREALDAAGIPTSARGGLMAGALRSGLIREVGTKRSVHPATHGKRIGCYEGVADATTAA